MSEPEKITIIEGPPPTFELVADSWLLSLIEGPVPARVGMCRVRAFNGPVLVERCYKAWRDDQPIHLEYLTDDGLTQHAPIIAIRYLEQPEGHLVLLWVRLDEDKFEVEIDFDFGDIDLDDIDDGDDEPDFRMPY